MRIQASQLGVQRYPPFTVHLRAPGVSGLGDDPACAPYPIADQLNMIYSSYANNIGDYFEQGTAADPASFAASITQQAQSFCSGSDWGCPAARCTVPTDLLNSLIAQYAQLYQSTMAQKAASIAAGDICVPSLAMFPGIQLSQRAIQGCGYGGASAAAAPSQPASSGSGSQQVSVQLVNSSRPGQPFQVGDGFTVTVIGPANSPVAVQGTQNGTNKGTTPFGSTDSTGRHTISGSMTPDTVGTWSEVWTVGGNAAPTLNFSVAAAPSGASTTTPPPSSASSSTTTPPPSSSTTSTSLSTIMTNLQAPSPVFGLPWLAVIGIGAIGLWWLSSRGKH